MAAEITTALVIGASRGLGHGLVQEFAKRGIDVTGTVRQPHVLEKLQSESTGHVTWLVLDVTEEKSLSGFIRNLPHPQYDVIFINAGISGAQRPSEEYTRDDVAEIFMTNTIAPIRLAKHLTSHVRPETGIMAFMTSRLGSVTLGSPSMEVYGASKAALNSLTETYYQSIKNTGITVLSMHPGWVKTDLGGDQAPLDVQTSVSGLVNVLEKSPGKGGHHFLDYQGETLPW